MIEFFGLAVGCIGMRPEDFDGMTPGEFDAVAKAYFGRRRDDLRDRWNRMRLLATIVVQPHTRRKITPEKLLPLPWDEERIRHKQQQESDSQPELSAQEKKNRFVMLRDRLGGCCSGD